MPFHSRLGVLAFTGQHVRSVAVQIEVDVRFCPRSEQLKCNLRVARSRSMMQRSPAGPGLGINIKIRPFSRTVLWSAWFTRWPHFPQQLEQTLHVVLFSRLPENVERTAVPTFVSNTCE